MKTEVIGNFVLTELEVKTEDLDGQDIDIKIQEQEVDIEEEVRCEESGVYVTMGQEVNKDMGLAIFKKLDEISRRLENVEKSQKMIVDHLKICSQKVNIEERPKNDETNVIINVPPEMDTFSTSELPSDNNSKIIWETQINEANLTDAAEVEKQKSNDVVRRKKKKSTESDSEAGDDRRWRPNQKKPKYSHFPKLDIMTNKKCSEKPIVEEHFDMSDTEGNLPSDHSSGRFTTMTCVKEDLPKKVSNKKCSKRPRDEEHNIDCAHSSGTSGSSSSAKAISKISYIPKTFSDLALSVLKAEQMSSSRLTRGRNQLSREILNYLEDEKLIQSSSPIRNKMEYKILGDQLSNLYGQFEWPCLGTTGHICQGLISCISRRRRSMRFKKNKSAKSLMNTELSPEEALVKLIQTEFF